jgi:hypothetical protein
VSPVARAQAVDDTRDVTSLQRKPDDGGPRRAAFPLHDRHRACGCGVGRLSCLPGARQLTPQAALAAVRLLPLNRRSLPPPSPRASDWKDQVAVVKVAVVTRGRDLALKLYRTDSEKLFAVCPIRTTGPAGFEPVSDSSRYFCLRIEDGKGNHAFIGEQPRDWPGKRHRPSVSSPGVLLSPLPTESR